MGFNNRHWNRTWWLVFVVVLAWSAFRPADYVIWLLEASPAIIAAAVLVATRERFPLTPLLYWLILAHAVVLMVGAHYTYAQVPVGHWLREALELERNNYDKLGHFMQGFVPAMVAREILLRLRVVGNARWLAFIVVAICLAISALYELVEWWVALTSEEAADAFLGTQGDVWDTQSDMAMALVGAVLAQVFLGRRHDTQLAALERA